MTRGLALLGLLVLPAVAHAKPGSASARLSVSVRVVRSVVVTSAVVVDAVKAAPEAREVVLDASGAPLAVAVQWEQRADPAAGMRWVTVLPDGASPLPVSTGDQPGW